MKGDVGSIGQNHIGADELLCCDIDQFLNHYAPFVPSEASVDSALTNLQLLKYLQNDGWQGLHGKNSPSKTKDIEAVVFRKLTSIVQALKNQECHAVDANTPRKCNFNYTDCGDTPMAREIAGCTFRIDAHFSPASSPSLSGDVVASQVAAAAGFKRKRKDFHDVSTRNPEYPCILIWGFLS